MANSFLTISMIGYAMLPVLHNNTIAAGKCTRKYESQFAKVGAKIGDTFMVRKPPKYVVTDGLTFVDQGYADEKVSLTVDQHKQVGVEFNDDDLTLSMDDFSGRVIQPALVPIANAVDVYVMSKYKQVWNATGTPGTVASTDTPFLDANTLLVNNAADMKEMWPQMVTPRVGARLSSGLAGRFNPQGAISGLYTRGRMNNSYRSMGDALGWDFYETQNMPTHVTGAWAGASPIVVEAAQSGANIHTSGWTASVTGLGKEGDVVQFAGVFQVNPITKNNIGELMNFTLTADVDSDSGTLATLPISPAIVLAGKNQNVSNAPAASAAITVWGTGTVANVASKTSPQCLGWSSDAITLACVDLMQFPKGCGVEQVNAKDEDLGLSICFSRGADIRSFSLVSRFDILFGTTLTRPEHIVRVAS